MRSYQDDISDDFNDREHGYERSARNQEYKEYQEVLEKQTEAYRRQLEVCKGMPEIDQCHQFLVPLSLEVCVLVVNVNIGLNLT